MADLSRMLKGMADPTRLRIVCLLNGRAELCVCEIAEALRVAQYSVSRHLAALKAAGVVADWRQGKWMHYALHRRLSAKERALIRAVCDRAGQEPAARQDQRRLERCLRPREKGGRIRCD